MLARLDGVAVCCRPPYLEAMFTCPWPDRTHNKSHNEPRWKASRAELAELPADSSSGADYLAQNNLTA